MAIGERKQSGQASMVFDRLVKLYPQSALLWLAALAASYEAGGQPSRANECFLRASALDPLTASAKMSLWSDAATPPCPRRGGLPAGHQRRAPVTQYSTKVLNHSWPHFGMRLVIVVPKDSGVGWITKLRHFHRYYVTVAERNIVALPMAWTGKVKSI